MPKPPMLHHTLSYFYKIPERYVSEYGYDIRQFRFQDSMAQEFQMTAPDTFGGHIVYFDRVEPVDLEIY